MKFNEGTRPADVDEIYATLCERLDRQPGDAVSDYLARLCLLLLGELSDKDRALALIHAADLAKNEP